jgi:hypothetical protein
MNPQKTERDTLLEVLDLARLAPSIHNSQPWRWRVEPRTVRLYADLRRWLPVTDQDGRDLMLSCGAALHHLRVALAASGIAARVRRLPDPDEPELLAVLALDPDALAEPGLGSVEPLGLRRTDRRRFNPWPVPAQFLDQLVQRAAEHRRPAPRPPRPATRKRPPPGAHAPAPRTGYRRRTRRGLIKRVRGCPCVTSATAPSTNPPTPKTAPSCWRWAPHPTTGSPSSAPARR